MLESPATRPASALRDVTVADLDVLLSAQLIVGWAGESGYDDDRRLGYWTGDLTGQYGGAVLFEALLPATWRWATLQAAREAARRHDARLRARHHAPDRLLSLYHQGFELDERTDERLQTLKASGIPPLEALPALQLTAAPFDRHAFTAWVAGHGRVDPTTAPAGRRLPGAPPASLAARVHALLAALAPLTDHYPLPHWSLPA